MEDQVIDGFGGGKPLVSVIVPVYNGEKYIERCLDSVLSQSYPNIELLVVDDGSTDGTGAVIERYCACHPGIICIRQTNRGLEASRQRGVESAGGKYIQYLDADDAFHDSEVIGNLVSVAESENADIVISPFIFRHGDRSEPSVPHVPGLISGTGYISLMLKGDGYFAIWAKFHKRSLYDEGIKRIGVSIGEDAVLSVQLLSRSRRAVCSRVTVIDYYVYDTSMSHKLNDKSFNDIQQYSTFVESYVDGMSDAGLAEGLAYFRTRIAMLKIHIRRMKEADADMPEVLSGIETWPGILDTLTRRERKIVNAYRRSRCLGRLLLAYYKRK